MILLEDATPSATIAIPQPLFKKIEDKIKGTHFVTVSSYVTYILQEVLTETEKSTIKDKLSEADEESVKQRLRALGYIE